MGKKDIWLGHVSATHFFVGRLRQGLTSVLGDPSRRVRELLNLEMLKKPQLTTFCMDTGCSITLVNRDLGPDKKLLEGKAVTIQCAHGDTHLASVELEVDGQHITVEAAISGSIPMAVRLRIDIPELPPHTALNPSLSLAEEWATGIQEGRSS